MSEESRRRADACLFLVSLVFLSSAGFLLLHALATPQILLTGRNAGFCHRHPGGAAAGGGVRRRVLLDLTSNGPTPCRAATALLRGGLLALMVVWAVVSLLGLPLDTPARGGRRGLATIMAVAGSACTRSPRSTWLHRRRPSVILIAILTAFALLVEAMVAVALARNWHASWWEWHLLMAFAFAFVYYSAHVQYAREGSWSSLFRGIYLQETIGQIRREHSAALERWSRPCSSPRASAPARSAGWWPTWPTAST